MRPPPSQFAAIVAALACCAGAADGPAWRDAVAAMQRGDFHAAELKLRTEIAAHPTDAAALSLLGVALDSQSRFPEAAEFHRRAVAAAPRTGDVLSNYGLHLAATGDEVAARDAFLKAVAVEPANVNANLQLARQSIQRKEGAQALNYLKHLPPAQLAAPPTALLRLEALYLTGDVTQADALAAKLSAATQNDAALSFSLGLAMANAGRPAPAEALFARVLAAAPADFNVLFNLGAVAASAGHYQRAREVFETASRQQPQNVEVLFRLAGVEYELQQSQAAVPLLVQAARLAPHRADIQKLLALATTSLGALEDAVGAWDAYLKLAPDDDFARRDRAYTLVRMGQLEKGIADLERFLTRHPDDAPAHYQMGVAQGQADPVQSLAHLDRAVALQPDFAAALSARGALYYQQGKPESAVADLEGAARLRPTDAANLDRLGQTYLTLDRAADGLRVLRQAAELSPGESRIQLHYARALADSGRTQESKVVMDRFRQLGPASKLGVPGGLVEFLSLTPAERRADYRGRVEKAVRDHPDDAAAQLNWLKLELQDGHADQATEVARRIAALKPAASLLADTGRALLAARQYALAKEILTAAESATPPADVALELNIATAQVLDAAGRHEEAVSALGRALAGAPPRADVWWQAAGLLVRNRRIPEAVALFGQAEDPEMLLMKAVLLELAGLPTEAGTLVNDVLNRRPEWHPAWVARGMMAAAHDRPEEVRHALEAAVALGSRSPEVRNLLAGNTRADLRELFLGRPPAEW